MAVLFLGSTVVFFIYTLLRMRRGRVGVQPMPQRCISELRPIPSMEVGSVFGNALLLVDRVLIVRSGTRCDVYRLPCGHHAGHLVLKTVPEGVDVDALGDFKSVAVALESAPTSPKHRFVVRNNVQNIVLQGYTFAFVQDQSIRLTSE